MSMLIRFSIQRLPPPRWTQSSCRVKRLSKPIKETSFNSIEVTTRKTTFGLVRFLVSSLITVTWYCENLALHGQQMSIMWSIMWWSQSADIWIKQTWSFFRSLDNCYTPLTRNGTTGKCNHKGIGYFHAQTRPLYARRKISPFFHDRSWETFTPSFLKYGTEPKRQCDTQKSIYYKFRVRIKVAGIG